MGLKHDSVAPAEQVSMSRRPHPMLIIIGALAGLFLSWGLLSGDAQGRVNLLHLLFVFVTIPMLSLIASLLSLVSGRNLNVATLVAALPLWSPKFRAQLRQLQQSHARPLWLLYQSQFMAIAFVLASLLVLLLLLLTTDVNFVWRSTLLDASDLLPLLHFLARPWAFLDVAQPTLDLLRQTRDSRMLAGTASAGEYGQWWSFILAVELVYGIATRLLLAGLTAFQLGRRLKAIRAVATIPTVQRTAASAEVLAELCRCIPRVTAVFNWADMTAEQIQRWATTAGLALPESDRILPVSPPESPAADSTLIPAAPDQGTLLVLVRAWEPPLAELGDRLRGNRGYLAPIDWRGGQFRPPETVHLTEWRRFAALLGDWRVFQAPISPLEAPATETNPCP